LRRKIFGPKKEEVLGSYRKLHNAKIHNLHYLPDFMKAMKSKRIKWAKHLSLPEEKGNVQKLFTRNAEGKRPLRRPRPRWDNYIKIDLEYLGYEMWSGFMWPRRALVRTVIYL
jgi:hypothetical protein